MADQITPISGDDILVWPDSTWCLRSEVAEYSHMSDDYIVIPVDSADWDAFLTTDGEID